MGTSTGISTQVARFLVRARTNERFREVLSIGGLGLAVVSLLGVAGWTWWAAVHPAAAHCHNAPLRVTRVSQLAGIAVCVAGFILGRVSARPKVVLRGNLQSGGRRHDEKHRAQTSALVQGALTAALLLITTLLAFEAVTLANGVWPITYYLRCLNEFAPYQTLVVAFAFWLLIGRWLWLPTPPRDVR